MMVGFRQPLKPRQSSNPLVVTLSKHELRCWDRRRPRLLVIPKAFDGNRAGEDACGPSKDVCVLLNGTTKGKLL